MTGNIYLIPSYLSEENVSAIPAETLAILHATDHFVVENEKSARHFLKAAGYPKPISSVSMELLNEHTSETAIAKLLDPVFRGIHIGIISEAGCPAVADPGSDLVRIAHAKNIKVIPLTGPSSILLALMASGLGGQSFTFSGYLPKDKPARIKAIRDLEKIAITRKQTQIFIEAPYRNQHLLEDILQTCLPATMLCLAIDLTSAAQSISTKTVSEWKKNIPSIQKKQAVFLLGS
jgi:16S rRNA (cytidine1402-2'-O)-methyltransferase